MWRHTWCHNKSLLQKYWIGVCHWHVTTRLCTFQIWLYRFQSKMSSFSISPWLVMRSRHWPDPRWPEWKVQDIKYNSSGTYYVLEVSSSSCKGRGIDGAAKSRYLWAVQRCTYDVIGQVADLTWKWDRYQKVRLELRFSRLKFHISV